MDIPKAIEIQTKYSIELMACLPDAECSAILLGIEALKRLDDHRHGKTLPFERWLPGETE